MAYLTDQYISLRQTCPWIRTDTGMSASRSRLTFRSCAATAKKVAQKNKRYTIPARRSIARIDILQYANCSYYVYPLQHIRPDVTHVFAYTIRASLLIPILLVYLVAPSFHTSADLRRKVATSSNDSILTHSQVHTMASCLTSIRQRKIIAATRVCGRSKNIQ